MTPGGAQGVRGASRDWSPLPGASWRSSV